VRLEKRGGSFSRTALGRQPKAGSRQLVLLPRDARRGPTARRHGLTYHSRALRPDGKGIPDRRSEGDDAVRLWVYPRRGSLARSRTRASRWPFPVPGQPHALGQTSDLAWHLVPLAGGRRSLSRDSGLTIGRGVLTDPLPLRFRRGELPATLGWSVGERSVSTARARPSTPRVSSSGPSGDARRQQLRVLAAENPVDLFLVQDPLARHVAPQWYNAAEAHEDPRPDRRRPRARVSVPPSQRRASIQTPSEFLGMRWSRQDGRDYPPDTWHYFKALDAAAPRFELEMLGKPTLARTCSWP